MSWAIDADQSETQLAIEAAKVLKPLAAEAQIYPVYAMDPEGLSWNGESADERTNRLRPAAEAALEGVLADVRRTIGLPNLQPPTILELHDVPIMGAVGALSSRVSHYSSSINADLILVSHHGRTGWSRMLHSSFTERLLLESDTPILAISPQTKVPETFREIVFPTDFSPACRQTFEWVVGVAQLMNCRLRLFHKVMNVLDPVVQSGVLILGGGWVSLSGWGDAPDLDHAEIAHDWVRLASGEGVDADFVSQDTGLSTAQTIASFCSRKPESLVVMTSMDGPLESTVWGSVTREVLKLATCPVLIIRSRESKPSN